MKEKSFFEKLEKQKNKNMKAKPKKIYLRLQKRFLNKICGTYEKPRLSIFRSNKHIYAQIINDMTGNTLLAVNSLQKEAQLRSSETKNCLGAFRIGQILAKKALEKNIKRVVFDRQNYKYQGRIKNLIEGARNGGLLC